jgi:hypothetical protein
MKMKWNWGTKLFIAIVLFMSLIIGFVIFSMRQTYYLVEKDYYPKGLEYQQKIDKETNAKKSGFKIDVQNIDNELVITFPAELETNLPQGRIILYRPSDGTLDISYPIQLDSLFQMKIPTLSLTKGKYIMKFDYSIGELGFFHEESLYIEK